jgi:hypothetical protein
MPILSRIWDAATSFLPFGNTINKLGRTVASGISDHAGIIGKVGGQLAREFIPESVRNTASSIADKAIDLIPEGKVKHTLQQINDTAQDRPNQYKKSDVTINPASDVYNSSMIKRTNADSSLHFNNNYVPDFDPILAQRVAAYKNESQPKRKKLRHKLKQD